MDGLSGPERHGSYDPLIGDADRDRYRRDGPAGQRLPASRSNRGLSVQPRPASLRYRFKAPRYKVEQSTSNFGLYSMTDLRPLLPRPIL
jgi:hypothetical protein